MQNVKHYTVCELSCYYYRPLGLGQCFFLSTFYFLYLGILLLPLYHLKVERDGDCDQFVISHLYFWASLMIILACFLVLSTSLESIKRLCELHSSLVRQNWTFDLNYFEDRQPQWHCDHISLCRVHKCNWMNF